MSINNDSIIIQQCLHGYERGHSLIESSITLPKESTSLILRMSDASSIGYTGNSPSYLTGYPLPEIGVYALARTWPAKDMSRPGCVWTHTLLIKFEYLAVFSDLGIFDQIFRYPDSNNLSFFSQAIKLNKSIENTECKKGSKGFTSAIFNELYVNKKSHILMPYSSEADASILNVWSKQWPKLRRSFKFRTYTSKASALNEYFNLSLYESSAYTYDEVRFKESELDIINVLLDDIFVAPNDSLKSFLWKYGADSKGLIDSYLPLVRVYDDLVSIVKCDEKNKLKLYGNDILDYVDVSKSLEKYLFQVVICSDYNEFSQEMINFILNKSVELKYSELIFHLKDFSIFISKIPFDQAMSFIFTRFNNSEIINSLICNFSNDKLVKVAEKEPNLLGLILQSRPKLLVDDSIIKLLNNIEFELIKDVIFEDELILCELIFKSVKAKSWYAIDKLIEHDEKRVLPHLVDVLNKLNYWEVESVSERILFSSKDLARKILISNVYVSINLLSAISRDLGTREFDTYKLDPWLLSLSKIDLKNTVLPENLALYLMLRGLKNIGSHPYLLLTISFDTIHHLISCNRLTVSGWDKLNTYLPQPKYFLFDTWDRCRKLRNGLIKKYIKYKMPIDKFIYVTSDKLTLKYLLQDLEYGYENKSFLKDLFNYLIESGINIEDDFSNSRLKELCNLKEE